MSAPADCDECEGCDSCLCSCRLPDWIDAGHGAGCPYAEEASNA